jgi:hypothetical protein
MRKPPTSHPAAPPAHFADPVIDEFLEGQPRSDTWRELRESLQARLDDARADLAAAPPDDPRRTDLGRRVRELKTQVAALAQEEAVTQFVEESVRASLSRPRSLSGNDDEDDDGGPY